MNKVTGKCKREVDYLRPAIYFALTKKKIIDETLNREIKKPKEMLSYFKLLNAPKDNSKKVSYPVGIYLLTVNRRCSGVFMVNFEHISHLALVFLLLTLNM